MNGNGGPASRQDAPGMWKAWRAFTVALLQQEREALRPYSETRLDDAEAYVDDILTLVRQARESAARVKEQHGTPPTR